jgi:hypothetical protein
MHARWALTLQEFDFEVKYRKRLVNMNADGLSRNPQLETEDLTRAREHDDLPGELVAKDPEPAASVMLAWQAWAADDLPEGVEPLSVEEAGWELGEPAEPENLAFLGNIDYGPPDVELPMPAEQGLGGERARALTDIWEDEHSLRFLRGDGLDLAWPEREQERVRRRCRSYRFANGVLIRTMTDGEDKSLLRHSGPTSSRRCTTSRGTGARSGTCSRRHTGGRACTTPPRKEWRSASNLTGLARPALQSR